jgi:hypothetical protein
MAPAPVAAPKVPPIAGGPQQQQKKKKNPPDRPQPAWLFPPKEENPVLTPKPKSEEEVKQEAAEYEDALNHLKRRVYSAPNIPAPPSHLLTMIGAFLAEYGFLSTGRLFTSERQARRKLNGWEDNIGSKLDKGTPSLVKIYKDWYRDWKNDETSSSESDDEEESTEEDAPAAKKGGKLSDSDEDESSESDSDSDVKMKDESRGSKKSKTEKKSSRPSASASTSSDSDDDDEEESKTVKTAPPLKQNVNSLINKLKRKASSPDAPATERANEPTKKQKVEATKTTATVSKPSPLQTPSSPPVTIARTTIVKVKSAEPDSSSSASSSGPSSASDSELKPDLKSTKASASLNVKKGDSKPVVTNRSSSEESEEEESDSSSSSESEGGVATANAPPTKSDTAITSKSRNSSTSSATVNGDSKKPSASSSADSSSSSATSDSEPDVSAIPAKKADSKSKPSTRPADRKGKPMTTKETAADANRISNAYIPNAYAERAHKDLSVTRGKGFTKEKNKKKRGSYRGGHLDLSGGRGYKFED